MCSIAKFCKATKEVFFSFLVLLLIYLQALKSVGGNRRANKLGCGKEDEMGVYRLNALSASCNPTV